MKLATLTTTLLLLFLIASVPAEAAKGGNGGGNGGGDPTPACSDGADNDGDGFTDYPNDPGCDSATDTDEYNAPPPTSPDPDAIIDQAMAQAIGTATCILGSTIGSYGIPRGVPNVTGCLW